MTEHRATRVILTAIYVFCVVFSPLGASRASAFTLKNRDIDVRDVCQMIARAAKINCVFSKDVRGKIAVELKDVPPLEALKLIAKINKLEVHEVEGLKNTYAIARGDDIRNNFEQGMNRVYTLSYAKAEEMQGILSKALGKSANLNVEVDARTNSLVATGSEEILQKVGELIKKLDKSVPQVLIDTKVVQVESNVLKDLGFNWNWGVGAASGQVDGSGGSGGLFALTEAVRNNYNQDFYQNAPDGAAPVFRFGDFFRGSMFINATFSALETHSLSRTLASPRLLAINGAQAQLRIGDKVVFTGGPSQPPEERETGIVLDVTPRINADGFITMEISVEQSDAVFQRADFPTIKQTRTKTTVQVKDGEEILVAGLVQEKANETKERIPFLSDIPLIKHLFKRERTAPETKELVLLVTPRVIKQDLPGVIAHGETPGPSPSGGGGSGGGGGLDDLDLDDDDLGLGGGGSGGGTGGGSGGGGGGGGGGDDPFDDSFDDDLDDL